MTTKNRPVNQVKAERQRARILRSAARIFGLKGYTASSLDDLARSMRATKGSIYYYFDSKDEILYQLSNQGVSRALESLQETVVEPRLAEVRLYRVVARHARILTREYPVWRVALHEERALPTEMRQLLTDKRNAFDRLLEELIAEGQAAGALCPGPPKMLAFTILGALNWMTYWYSPAGPLTGEQIGEIMADYLIRGALMNPARVAEVRAAAREEVSLPRNGASRRGTVHTPKELPER